MIDACAVSLLGPSQRGRLTRGMRPPAACTADSTSAAARSRVTYSLPLVVYSSSSPRRPSAFSFTTSSTTFRSDKRVCGVLSNAGCRYY